MPSSGRMTHPEPWVMVRQRPSGASARKNAMPAPARSTIASVLDHVDANLPASRDNLFDLLRIKSVSAQPVHAPDCVKAAEWWRDQLTGLGLRGRRCARPLAIRWWSGISPAPPDYKGPHILFYGHYDVQPVDPLSLWHSDPFDPQLVDGPRGKRYVARGAVDDKGQTLMFLEALRAWQDRRRRHPGTHHRADRRRGRGRFSQPRPVPAREQDGACRRTWR